MPSAYFSKTAKHDALKGAGAGSSLRALRLPVVMAASVTVLTACFGGPPPSIVHVPTYPPLMGAQTALAEQGGIYQPGTAVSLYETPRARHVGDVLTVMLDESFTTSNAATTDSSRGDDITAKSADGSVGLANDYARWANVGTSNSKFSGKGSITGSGSLKGTMAVSVISVLPSGNLMVSGDKIIATNNDNENIRFSGIVNPIDIQSGNTIASSKIANARIEQQGLGVLHDTTSRSWLQRMFY